MNKRPLRTDDDLAPPGQTRGHLLTADASQCTPFSEVRAALGAEGTTLLCKAFGGRRIYIPKTLRPNSPVLKKLGEADAQKLVALFAREYLEVPLQSAPRLAGLHARIEAYLRAHPKATKDATARKFRVHRRTVQRVRSAMAQQRREKREALRVAFERDAPRAQERASLTAQHLS